jgi:hypothetical protein
MANHNKSLSINLYASIKHKSPALELRVLTQDTIIIKKVINAAWEDKPIILYPVFRSKPMAIAKLIEVGILKKNKETGEYVFAL